MKRHHFLFCEKTGQRRHTSICQIKEKCAWLVEHDHDFRCLFIPKQEKRVQQHQSKKEALRDA